MNPHEGVIKHLENLPECPCFRCNEALTTATYRRFMTCPFCGNKRCPKGTDHRHQCTESNEPGQAGSIYQ